MVLSVDTSESRAEGGGGMVEAGEYHWIIDEITAEENNDFDSGETRVSLKVVCQVVAGTKPECVGRKQTEFFQLSGKAVDRLRRLLVATNMMTDQQWVERIGQPLEFDERLLKSRQFCSRIKMDPYRGRKPEHQGKSFPAMGFDIWSVWDEKSKNIPKDPECLALLGPPPEGAAKQTTAPQQSAGGNGGSGGAQQPSSQQPAGQSANSQFSW